MILRVTLLSDGDKKPKVYNEPVSSVEDARIKWANILVLGIFSPTEKRFIAPWQIKEAVVIDEEPKSEKKQGIPVDGGEKGTNEKR